MHFDICEVDCLFSQSSLFNGSSKYLLNFCHLSAHCDFLIVKFKHILQQLLEDHDNDQVQLECVEILIVENSYKVGYVGIDELEHVGFVNERIFVATSVTMILIKSQSFRKTLVYLAKSDDQAGVDYTRKVLPNNRHFLRILISTLTQLPFEPLQDNLTSNHHRHEG